MPEFRALFGCYELNLETGELWKAGRQVKLSPQPARLLCLLAGRPGELITRDEARHHLWGQDEFVDFDLGLNHCMKRIRAALRDSPRRPRFIETIPRRGYKFVATREKSNPPDEFTLAVLPFENLNHDPEHDCLADGFAEAVLTGLSAMPALRLISRQSVVHLKGTAMTIPEIATEIKADLLVLGSVFRQGSRIRVSVQLVLTNPEQQVWAQAYEANDEETLAIQRELAQAVVWAVRSRLPGLDEKRHAAPV